jgi:hypothetical protein
VMLLVAAAVIVLIALPWWSLVGLPMVQLRSGGSESGSERA